jgi:hypothetical protein
LTSASLNASLTYVYDDNTPGVADGGSVAVMLAGTFVGLCGVHRRRTRFLSALPVLVFVALASSARALSVTTTQTFQHASSFSTFGSHGGISFSWDIQSPGPNLTAAAFSFTVDVTAGISEYNAFNHSYTATPFINVDSVASVAGIPFWMLGQAARVSTNVTGDPVVVSPSINGQPVFAYSFSATIHQTFEREYTAPNHLAWFNTADVIPFNVSANGNSHWGSIGANASVSLALTYVYDSPGSSVAAPDGGSTAALMAFGLGTLFCVNHRRRFTIARAAGETYRPAIGALPLR